MSLDNLRIQIEQARGKYNQLKSERVRLSKELKQLKEKHIHTEQARVLLQEVAKATQSQIEYYISDIVSLALAAVYDNPYIFKSEFVTKRGKTECELSFIRNDRKLKPLDASGGGAVDVASFALRLSLWSLNKNRPVMILDEPLKHLSVDLQQKALTMIKKVSQKLGIQIIMVSHSREFIEGADRVIEVKNQDGISRTIQR